MHIIHMAMRQVHVGAGYNNLKFIVIVDFYFIMVIDRMLYAPFVFEKTINS